MREASKTKLVRAADFEDKYLRGKVIDIGAGDDLVCSWAEGFDVGDGDANAILRHRQPESYDAVHSSHCLEHMWRPQEALAQWWALVRTGGHMIIVVPDEDLYEQGIWPSLFNDDHKQTFRMEGESSWSPVSHNFPALCAGLDKAIVVSAVRQDVNYDYAKQLKSERISPVLKWGWRYGSAIWVVPYFGLRIRRRAAAWIRRKLGASDQTSGPALAQIEVILKKTA